MMISRTLRCILSAAVIGSLAPAFAQVSIGPRIGMSLSNMEFNSSTNSDLVEQFEQDMTKSQGVDLAVPLEVRLGDNLSFQAEPGVTMRGLGFDNGQGSSELRLNYLTLALLPKVIIERGPWGGEIFLGPGFGFGLSTRSISDPQTSPDEAYDELYKFNPDLYSAFQMDLVVGGGLRYRVGVPVLFLNYRYAYGLFDVYATDILFTDVNGSTISTVNARNRCSIISIGMLIPLSGDAWRSPSNKPSE